MDGPAQLRQRLVVGLLDLLGRAGVAVSPDREERTRQAVELMVRLALDEAGCGGADSLAPADILRIRCSKFLARELSPDHSRQPVARRRLRAGVKQLVGGLLATETLSAGLGSLQPEPSEPPSGDS